MIVQIFNRFCVALFLGAIIVITVAGLSVSLPKFSRAKRQKAEVEKVVSQIKEREAEIADVRERQRRMKDDRKFVESVARESRRVYPGELVFVFDK